MNPADVLEPTATILDTPVNLFAGTKITKPVKTLTLTEALTLIQNGTYHKKVQRLQYIRTTEGADRYKKAKEQLDAVTFCGTFSPTRAKAHLTRHSGIVHGDLDHLENLDATKQALCADQYTVYCFTSPSGEGLKVGVYVIPVTADEAYKHAWQLVADYHRTQYNVTWDPTGKDVSRLCFVSHDTELYRNLAADVFPIPPYIPPTPTPRPLRPMAPIPADLRERYAQQAITTAVAMIDASTPGDRHATRLKAGTLLGGYVAGDILIYSEAHDALKAAVERNTKDFARSMQTIAGALAHGQAHPITLDKLEAERHDWVERQRTHQRQNVQRQRHTESLAGEQDTEPLDPRIYGSSNGAAQPKASAPDSLPWSDYTNALALVRDHGKDLRYCHPWKKWLIWTGSHWHSDDTGEAMRRGKQTIKKLARHVEDLDDDLKITAFLRHIKSSLSTAKLKAMLESAQSEESIPVLPEPLDRDPWLLNCRNGTLDLQSGILRAHDRKDLLTKCLDTDYLPNAQCEEWKSFLWKILDHNQTLIDFVQRAIGYSLTGSTREQCLFILHGPTKTGKSTFLMTLRALLGPYGQQADMASFMHKERDEVRNDLAALAGSRVVCALEAQEGRRLAEALIKQLTGGVDVIKARFLFQEYFEYTPQFKVFLGTNHKPIIGV